MAPMRATVLARGTEAWEATLNAGDRAEATARFLHLATSELDRAYRLAGLLLGDRAEAEDATQEALVRAWRAIASLRDPQGFQAWFDRILVNVCRDHLRRRGRVRFISLAAIGEPSVTADPFRAVLDRDEVLRALASLDDDERLVIVLHYWADLTLASIAQRAGWRLGTVKSRLHRALRRIEAALHEDPADPSPGVRS
jgi:RNA polymerase sigma-70 factor (ECF subfamily)